MARVEIWAERFKALDEDELYYISGLLCAEMRCRRLNYDIQLVSRKTK